MAEKITVNGSAFTRVNAINHVLNNWKPETMTDEDAASVEWLTRLVAQFSKPRTSTAGTKTKTAEKNERLVRDVVAPFILKRDNTPITARELAETLGHAEITSVQKASNVMLAGVRIGVLASKPSSNKKSAVATYTVVTDTE